MMHVLRITCGKQSIVTVCLEGNPPRADHVAFSASVGGEAMPSKTVRHPSEILQSGTVRDLPTACEVDRAQIDHEYRLFPDLNTDQDRIAWEAAKARVDTAERLYREIVAPALAAAHARCAAALRAVALDHYARALESGDYTGLAI